MNKSLVSIIMPVYNAEPYIEEAINSVLVQTHKNWELLIINDGSTDRSEKIIKSYKDERLIYFKQENKGVSAARNMGLANILGDFFCFLDADDLLTPRSIQDRIAKFTGNPTIEFVDGPVDVFNTITKKIAKKYIPNFKGNPHNELLNLSSRCFFGPTWMIKKIKEKHYGFKEGLTHAEDLLFYISISNTGIYDYVDKTIYKYRSGTSSAMSNLSMLEKGYFEVYSEILKTYINTRKFKKKIKSIMFKSYLRNLSFFRAFKVLVR